MTIADPRSDRNGKVEPAPPETDEDIGTKRIVDRTNEDLASGRDREGPPPWSDYDPAVDSYRSWQEVIAELHARMVAVLVADHDNRMPKDWKPDGKA
jgi:hypothetical protein